MPAVRSLGLSEQLKVECPLPLDVQWNTTLRGRPSWRPELATHTRLQYAVLCFWSITRAVDDALCRRRTLLHHLLSRLTILLLLWK